MSNKYQAYAEYKDSGVEWLGKVPVYWHSMPLKLILRTRKGVAFKSNDFKDYGIRVVKASDIKELSIRSSDVFLAKEFEELYPKAILNTGDIVLSTVGSNPDVKNSAVGQLGMVPQELNGTLLNQNTVIFDPDEKQVAKEYLFYVLQITGYRDHLDLHAHGTANQSSLSISDMLQFQLPIPYIDEQHKIANFLDHETAKIDTLIEKQQQLIKLLKEKRQAVISHAVTKGLNPNAPMRESGVEWLGDVPEHWDVKKFKFLCNRIIAGPFGSSITKDMYVKQGYKVYGQEQVIPNDFEIGDYYINEKDYLELSRYIVDEGDILISCVGTFGKIAVFPKGAERGIINPRLIKSEINLNHNPYYIREMLKSEMVFKQFELLSRGGTMGVINIAILSEILAAVPPIDEQSDVIDHINEQKEKFSNLIGQANKAVQLLQERRTALISAAVTGKIDLRNWQVANKENKETAL